MVTVTCSVVTMCCAARTSLEAVSGYSLAIAALLATVRYSELGVPSSKAKVGLEWEPGLGTGLMCCCGYWLLPHPVSSCTA